jgi:hypothetical protein
MQGAYCLLFPCGCSGRCTVFGCLVFLQVAVGSSTIWHHSGFFGCIWRHSCVQLPRIQGSCLPEYVHMHVQCSVWMCGAASAQAFQAVRDRGTRSERQLSVVSVGFFVWQSCAAFASWCQPVCQP